MDLDDHALEATLLEIARLLELKGENPFKVRAYENAARALASLDRDAVALARAGGLEGVPGIGESIREKLHELATTGRLAYLEELREGVPVGLFDVMRVPGLGAKKTKALWEQLGVVSLETLEAACREGHVAGLKGFGKKTQENIVAGLAQLARARGRVLRADALPQVRELAARLAAVPGVERVELAGSIRRGRETVKDGDVLVASRDPEPVMDAVVGAPGVQDVIGRGPTKTSVHLASGLQVDVRVVEPEAFASALVYFTGSKAFNVALRQRALDLGFSLNEYALRPLDGTPPPALADEAALFRALGLAWVPPELREDTGELALAASGGLPRLVEPADLRGVLHVHTRWSDGAHTVDEMVAEAARLGYEYVGISDHSQAARYANGLDPARLAAQREEVEAARAAHPGIRVLHGIECDILADGALDLPDDCLARLDFVIASVHTELGMERDRMTARLVRAVSHPAVRVLGHPLGRRLLEREASSFDWEPVLDAALANGVAIEVNGQPERLDADWVHIKRIRARGVKLCLNPDAHGCPSLDHARTHAVLEARRGWAGPADVVNALPADRFVAEFLRPGAGQGGAPGAGAEAKPRAAKKAGARGRGAKRATPG